MEYNKSFQADGKSFDFKYSGDKLTNQEIAELYASNPSAFNKYEVKSISHIKAEPISYKANLANEKAQIKDLSRDKRNANHYIYPRYSNGDIVGNINNVWNANNKNERDMDSYAIQNHIINKINFNRNNRKNIKRLNVKDINSFKDVEKFIKQGIDIASEKVFGLAGSAVEVPVNAIKKKTTGTDLDPQTKQFVKSSGEVASFFLPGLGELGLAKMGSDISTAVENSIEHKAGGIPDLWDNYIQPHKDLFNGVKKALSGTPYKDNKQLQNGVVNLPFRALEVVGLIHGGKTALQSHSDIKFSAKEIQAYDRSFLENGGAIKNGKYLDLDGNVIVTRNEVLKGFRDTNARKRLLNSQVGKKTLQREHDMVNRALMLERARADNSMLNTEKDYSDYVKAEDMKNINAESTARMDEYYDNISKEIQHDVKQTSYDEMAKELEQKKADDLVDLWRDKQYESMNAQEKIKAQQEADALARHNAFFDQHNHDVQQAGYDEMAGDFARKNAEATLANKAVQPEAVGGVAAPIDGTFDTSYDAFRVFNNMFRNEGYKVSNGVATSDIQIEIGKPIEFDYKGKPVSATVVDIADGKIKVRDEFGKLRNFDEKTVRAGSPQGSTVRFEDWLNDNNIQIRDKFANFDEWMNRQQTKRVEPTKEVEPTQDIVPAPEVIPDNTPIHPTNAIPEDIIAKTDKQPISKEPVTESIDKPVESVSKEPVKAETTTDDITTLANKVARLKRRMSKEVENTDPTFLKTSEQVKSLEARLEEVKSKLSIEADNARANIQKRNARLNMGFDPMYIKDYAVIGADYIVKGAKTFKEFSKRMIAEHGKLLVPHMPEIFKKSLDIAKKLGKESVDVGKQFSKAAESAKTAIYDSVAPRQGREESTAISIAERGKMNRHMSITDKLFSGILKETSKFDDTYLEGLSHKIEAGDYNNMSDTEKNISDFIKKSSDTDLNIINSNLRALGAEKIKGIENYITHIFDGSPEEIKTKLNKWLDNENYDAKMRAKVEQWYENNRLNKIGGSDRQINKRVIPSYKFAKDVIGLEMKTKNPVRLALESRLTAIRINNLANILLKAKDYGRAISQPKIANEAGKMVLDPKWKAPEGWVKVPSDVLQTIGANWWVSPDMAFILKRGMEQGYWHNDWYKSIRHTSNILTRTSLALASNFHFGVINMEAGIGKLDTAIYRLFMGDFKNSWKTLHQIPYASADYFAHANKFIEAYKDPNLHPEMQPIIKLFTEGGGRIDNSKLNSTLTDSFGRNVRESLGYDVKNGKIIAATAKAPLAIIEILNSPLMEHFIPRVKIGTYMEFMDAYIQTHPAATEMQIMQNSQRIWRTIENRFGQLDYDNLLFTRKLRDILPLFIQAPGWNIGSFSEQAGSIRDWITAPSRIKQVGYKEAVTRRMTYALSATTTQLLTGYMITRLAHGYFTGNWKYKPTGKELMSPSTGVKDENGNEIYLQLPTIMRDILAIGDNGILETLGNKESKFYQISKGIVYNEKYNRQKIWFPDDSPKQKMDASIDYLLDSIEPMGIREYFGNDILEIKAAKALALSKSPRYITESAAEKKMNDLVIKNLPNSREESDLYDEKSALRQQMGKRNLSIKEKQELLYKAYNDKIITKTTYDTMTNANNLEPEKRKEFWFKYKYKKVPKVSRHLIRNIANPTELKWIEQAESKKSSGMLSIGSGISKTDFKIKL